jgi:outer membrane protein TolC
VPLIEQAYASAVNRLSVLLARPPADVAAALQPRAAIPLAPLPAVGIPADTLRRRPDVLAAEQALVAELARIGVRQADLYPALRLGGSFGGVGTSLANATDAALASAVASLTAPLFDAGRLRAAVEQQRAAADASLAAYRGTLLTAVEETENALVAVDVAARREVELLVALEAAQNAASMARSQYQTGLTDFQTLLDAERSLLATEESSAGALADRATATVRLYKALGGGWDSTAVPALSGSGTVTTEPSSR